MGTRITSPRLGIFASAGGVGAALLAAACCAVPLLLASLGVGAGLLSVMMPLRWPLTALMVAFFLFGFLVLHLRGNGRRASEESPTDRLALRRVRLLFWGAVVAALLIWTAPFWGHWLAGGHG